MLKTCSMEAMEKNRASFPKCHPGQRKSWTESVSLCESLPVTCL